MLYVFELELFLRKLRANSILWDFTSPSATTTAKYSAYSDDVSVLVTSSAEVEEVNKESEGLRMWLVSKLKVKSR